MDIQKFSGSVPLILTFGIDVTILRCCLYIVGGTSNSIQNINTELLLHMRSLINNMGESCNL